jgi:hypothetical protein
MLRRSTLTIALGVAVALGSLAAGAAASSPPVKGSSGPLAATLQPSTHTPTVNKKWPIVVTATLKGKPAHASAVYEYLFNGIVVATRYPNSNKHFTFTGHFSDNLVFTPPSAGEPLTLRVVIKASGHTVNLDWAVTPQK